MNCFTPHHSADCNETATPMIRELPDNLRPRERLLEHGAPCLSDAELLALFLSPGTKGRSAIELSRMLIGRHGSLNSIGSMRLAELSREHGIGPAKASRLVAAFELGARVSREQLHDRTLDSPERIHASYAPQLQHLGHEQVMVATVDCRLHHLSTSLISVGSVNESIAHPRDILRPVIARGAHGFILVHNHPSGDPSPSSADHEVTRRVNDAASLMQLRFIDHVIIGRPGSGRQAWFSFREAGRLSG